MLSEAQNIDLHPVADTRHVVEQVPLIDIGELIRDAEADAAAEAIEQIAKACRSWGFFQIINHGIPSAQINAVWQQVHAFFDLPVAEKLQIVRTRDNPWGFYNNELTKNQRDKKEVFDFTCDGIDPVYGMENRWPQHPPGFDLRWKPGGIPARSSR